MILDVTNIPKYLRLKNIIDKNESVKVSFVDEGRSNFVFRVKTKDKVLFIKQARNVYKGFQNIRADPKRILTEATTINLINSIFRNNDVIPRLILYDPHNNVIITSDLKRNGKYLELEFKKGRTHKTAHKSLALFLSNIHTRFYGLGHTNEKERWNLKRRCINLELGSDIKMKIRNDISKLVKNALKANKTLIFADLTPKNMFVEGKKIRFVDLEDTHFGDLALEIGFFIGHHYIYGIKSNSLPKFEKTVEYFVNKYITYINEKLNLNHIDEEYIKRIFQFCGTTILYRIYGFSRYEINSEQKKELINIALEMIKNKYQKS